MAKARSKPTPSIPVSAKLRKALAAFAGDYTSIQAQIGQVRVSDLNELLAAHRAECGRFERELADRADLLLREIAPPQRRAKTPKRTPVKAVVRELWPSGVPKAETNKELLWRLGKELKRRGVQASDTTMLRALGRRRTK